MIDPTILEGALDAAAGKRLGYTIDETINVKRQNHLAKLRDQQRKVAMRKGNRGVTLEEIEQIEQDLINNDSALLDLDKYFYTEKGTEYGADEADIAIKTEQDKEIEGKAAKRLTKYYEDLGIEQQAREGIFDKDVSIKTRKERPFPTRNANPRKDSFVVQDKQGPVRFPYQFGAGYSERMRSEGMSSAAIDQNLAQMKQKALAQGVDLDAVGKDGVIKRAMAERRRVGNYDKSKSKDFNQAWRDKVYNALTGKWEQQEGRSVSVYPGDRQRSLEFTDTQSSGRSNDQDMLLRITEAINSGSITDPAQLQEALKLQESFLERVAPQQAIANERALARKLSASIEAQVDQRKRESNQQEWNQFKEEQIRRSRDPNRLARLGKVQIASSGVPKERGAKRLDYVQEVPLRSQLDVDNFPDAYKYAGADVYVDGPGGASLATDDYNYAYRYDPTTASTNAPTTSQALNAPTNNNLQDLIERERYSARQSGTYPQVSIAAELDTFAQRLGKLGKLMPDGNLHVRSAAEAEELLKQVADQGLANETKFYKFGTKEFDPTPGPESVLAKMRYNSNEMKRLMNALYQIDMANSSGVNQAAKDVFIEGGSYMPQRAVGQPVADLRINGIVPGAATPGKNYYEMNSPEQMSDYAITDDLMLANSRNAPQFRALAGDAVYDATPGEKEAALADAQRSFVGQLKGESVGIEGKQSNPNLRFNKFGNMAPADVAIAVEMQAKRRAQQNGKELTETQLQRVASNARNAQAVAERHNAEQVQPPTDRVGKEQQARIQSVLSHVNRDKPAYEVEQRNVYQMPYGRKQNDERSQAERAGIGASGISSPPPEREAFNPNAGKTVVSLGEAAPITDFTPGDTKRGLEKRKAQVSNIIEKMRAPENTVRRRIGYGVAGVAGLGGLAGLISGERNRREEEAIR